MHCIKLLLTIDGTKERIYKALSSVTGLSQWWTVQTFGNSNVNELIDFRFGEKYHIQMRVMHLDTNNAVHWECTLADEDWIGTTVSFELETVDNMTQLRFKHDKWPTHSDFFAHCNLSWAKYLLSLREYIETGVGKPFSP